MAQTTSVTLSRGARVPVFAVLAVLGLTILYPIGYLAVSAFRSKSDYLANPFGLPRQFTVDNFVNLWNNYAIGNAFVNSVTVIAVALTVQLLIAGLAGYALAKLPVPGGKAVRGLFALIMLVPSQVLIIPIYLLLANLGLVGSLSGLMVVYVATGLPFATFFLSITFSTVDNDVLEAARVDGAGFLRGFVSVALPMGASGVATLGVLQFLGMWNELLFAYILLPDDSLRLITPALAAIGGRFTGDPTLVAAGLILTSLPPVILLIAAARHVMSGVGASLGR